MAVNRDAELTFGATDYFVHMAAVNTAMPAAFADPATPWISLGWITTDGGVFKTEQEQKDVEAAGSLEPIRTLMTKSTKTNQVTFLEGINPAVRSLYDNVPLASLEPTTGVVTYDLPDKPADLRYAFLFDTKDGDKRMRLYMPNGLVVERGDEQPQTQDVMPLQMTFKFFRGTGGTAAVKRSIHFGGVDVSGYFPGP
ncbi:phage tail protein [Streptomyces sp. CAU 1734]|uniref:phage tail tube protein n=1 Tax=Streptomyces sp. CAU 1734 TaxID=3140360 RepID=UPI003260B85B